jgi:hypothetical protein
MKNENKSLIEILKNLSGWTKGTITLLTILVSFVILFRENFSLMLILIFVLFSIAGTIAMWYVLIAKTPPLIEGGKGVYKYANFRKGAIGGIIVLAGINILFYASDFGNKTVDQVVRGTPTAIISSPAASPSANTQATTTHIPFPEDIISTKFFYGVCGDGFGRDFLIPNEIDLNQDHLELMDQFFSQKVWQSWEQLPRTPNHSLKITHIDPDGNTINIDNTAYVVIDVYEPLDHIDIANFSDGSGWFIGADICGGGAVANIFDITLLQNTSEVEVDTKEYDYFTLQPGEVEYFDMKIACGEPGFYSFHIEMSLSYFDNEKRVNISPDIKMYCPKAYDRWVFTNISSADYENDVYEPHTVYFTGSYLLQSIDVLSVLQDDNLLNEEELDLYQLSDPFSSWVETRSWKPCSDSPESIVFGNPMYKTAVINPNLTASINVRKNPSPNEEINAKALPGHIVTIGKKFECSSGYVWWPVEHAVMSEQGVLDYYSGWVAEHDGEDRILIPCLGNPDCDND